MLHDIALVADHAGDPKKSFEENGGAFARDFAIARGVSADRADVIAKAIVLHAGQAQGLGSDIEFVMVGAAQDVFGPSEQQLSNADLVEVERTRPRLRFKTQFLALLAAHVARTEKPTWTAAFATSPPRPFLSNRWSA